MPHQNITPSSGNVVPLRRSSPAHQLERAIVNAEPELVRIVRGFQDLREHDARVPATDAHEQDYAVRFEELLLSLELAATALVVARLKAVAS